MVKDPDFAELYADNPTGPTDQEMFEGWRKDFEQMEAAVRGTSSEDWADYIDIDELVKYVFVNSLVGNHEPGWPKSVYLHKATKEDKYTFGPLWDFDWAYTFGGNYMEGVGTPNSKWVALGGESGGRFFTTLCSDARFREKFKQLVERFYNGELDAVMEYIDEYAALIRPAAYKDGERWPTGCDSRHPNVASSEEFDKYLDTMKKFLKDRIAYMYSDTNFGLY